MEADDRIQDDDSWITGVQNAAAKIKECKKLRVITLIDRSNECGMKWVLHADGINSPFVSNTDSSNEVFKIAFNNHWFLLIDNVTLYNFDNTVIP